MPTNTVVNFVPQQEAWVVERFGKFLTVLQPGLRILLPVIDTIKYVHSLKEIVIEIPSQSAITQDNVTLHLDTVLYLKIFDAYKVAPSQPAGAQPPCLQSPFTSYRMMPHQMPGIVTCGSCLAFHATSSLCARVRRNLRPRAQR